MFSALPSAYLAAEVVGGIWFNSLALLADAGHMLTDVFGLALALFAIWFSEKKATPEKTYGYYRVEILAALTNATSPPKPNAKDLRVTRRIYKEIIELESCMRFGI